MTLQFLSQLALIESIECKYTDFLLKAYWSESPEKRRESELVSWNPVHFNDLEHFPIMNSPDYNFAI